MPVHDSEIAHAFDELVRTGHLRLLDEIHHQVPETLTEILAVPRIGPKPARAMFQGLGVRPVDGLRAAAAGGRRLMTCS